jgi:hypothetical protein
MRPKTLTFLTGGQGQMAPEPGAKGDNVWGQSPLVDAHVTIAEQPPPCDAASPSVPAAPEARNRELPPEFAHIAADTRGDSAPCGTVGPASDRDARTGRFVTANRAALVAGQHSAAFWQVHIDARRAIVEGVLSDAGHTPDDAPRALQLAADGIAQAALMRDSAFSRVVQSGGPLTSAGRTRRAFGVWLVASDRLEKYLRLVGLRRVPRNAAATFEAAIAAEPEAR